MLANLGLAAFTKYYFSYRIISPYNFEYLTATTTTVAKKRGRKSAPFLHEVFQLTENFFTDLLPSEYFACILLVKLDHTAKQHQPC